MNVLPAVLLVSSSIAAAAEPLSLPEAQAEARTHAPEALELSARLRAADRAVDVAARLFRSDPDLEVRGESEFPSGAFDTGRIEATLGLTLDLSSSSSSSGASAQATRDATRQNNDDELRALDEAVALAFAELQRSQRRVTRAEQLQSLQAAVVIAAHKQLDVGGGNQLDVDAAELDSAGARAEVARARGSIRAAQAQLARWIGRSDPQDVVVEDLVPSALAPPVVDVDAHIDAHPRVRAALLEVEAARLLLEAEERRAWPQPTLALGYGVARHDIPPGSFSTSPALSAAWIDQDLALSLSAPLPIFDANIEARSAAANEFERAQVRLAMVRADVRHDIGADAAALVSALAAFAELRGTPALIVREYELLDRAIRAGSSDLATRTTLLRRLDEAGQRVDDAMFDLAIARAHWDRNRSQR